MAANEDQNSAPLPASSAPLSTPTASLPKTSQLSSTSKLTQSFQSPHPPKSQPSQHQPPPTTSSVKLSLPVQQPLPSRAYVPVNPSPSPQPSVSKSIAQSSPPPQVSQRPTITPSTHLAVSVVTTARPQVAPLQKPSLSAQVTPSVQGPASANLAPAIFPNVPAQPIVVAPSTVPTESPSQRSVALEIARLITDYLGPNYSRRDAVGGTLSGLRTRLETDSARFDNKRESLVWQIREAIRTEFFKIVYPAPPSQALLNLVATTETLLGAYHLNSRPFFFPGARVAVPTEAGSRRAGTTLQLRFKVVAETTVTEALLHLDAPNGGAFQWVQTPALTPLIAYIQPQRRVQKTIPPQGNRRATTRSQRGASRSRHAPRIRGGVVTARRKVSVAQKTTATPHASAPTLVPKVTGLVASASTKAPTITAASPSPSPPPPPPPPPPPSSPPLTSPPSPPPSSPPAPPPQPHVETRPTGPLALPPTFLPESLLETGPPPRKRLREGTSVVTSGSGSLRRALDAKEGEGAEGAVKKIKRLIGIERLVARRKVEEVEYYVKWCGRSLKEGSWERRAALMVDLPGMVLDFDTRHPELPKVVCHSNRVKTMEEMRTEKSEGGLGVEQTSGEGTRAEKEDTPGKRENEDAMDVDANVIDDAEHNTSSELRNATDRTSEIYFDEVTGTRIPPYLDTPILELSFSGMLLQIRRPNEYALHNDAASASRDYKRRQSRFKQENLSLGGRLFSLSRTEAKSALDASLRSHKAHGRHLIPFPRGIGHVSPADTGVPFSSAVVEAAPPSWERYFTGLGLHAKRFERNLPPFFPSLDERGAHKLALAARGIVHERAVEHRERARRVVRMAHRHGQIAGSPACLFRDKQRRPGECAKCFPIETSAKAKTRSPRVPPPNEQLVQGKDVIVAKAIASVKRSENRRWFDAHWSCWRGENGRSVED